MHSKNDWNKEIGLQAASCATRMVLLLFVQLVESAKRVLQKFEFVCSLFEGAKIEDVLFCALVTLAVSVL
jgi:hypothetical protein